MSAAPRLFHILACIFIPFVLSACQLVPSKPTGVREPSMVMILPGSGSYVSVAARVMRGAQAARKDLEAHGTKIRLAFVDSTKADWLSKLAALPEGFVTIGGPLEPKVYSQLVKSGLLEKKVCFAFMNNLNSSDEGRLAYRFFPGPQDQVDALVSFSTEQLKIRSFGSFAGADAYSTRMVNLFEQTLKKRNLPLQKASYSGLAPATLKAQAKILVNPTMEGAVAVPQTPFEALFIPATFRQLDAITAAFSANGEDRLVMLGTMSWEQSVSGKRIPSPERYELAVFPGAWKSTATVPSLGKDSDFWTALGYDFVQFATNLALASKVPPADLIDRANRASRALTILAPISWDKKGIAHQKLFVYRVTAQGLTRMDAGLLNRLREKHKEKAAMRLETGYVGESQEGQLPQETVIAPQPVSAPAATQTPKPTSVSAPSGMGTVPQTSYKLRLPVRRPTP